MVRKYRYIGGIGAIACLLGSTAAVAADATRSADALPTAAARTAPTQAVRTATPLKKKSNALGRNGIIALAIIGGAAVGTGLYLAIDDNDDEPDSPG